MITMTHRFYKEGRIWYIDLPEFIEQGFGSLNNLMMVGGADTFLDKLSNHGNEVTVKFGEEPFDGYTHHLVRTKLGKDDKYLSSVGHAEVDGGAYYVSLTDMHELWLCPVTKYVFRKDYPSTIYLRAI